MTTNTTDLSYTISGPDQFRRIATYTMTGYLPDTEVHWEVTPPLQIVSGQGTPQVLLSLEEGSQPIQGEITATFTRDGITETHTKPLCFTSNYRLRLQIYDSHHRKAYKITTGEGYRLQLEHWDKPFEGHGAYHWNIGDGYRYDYEQEGWSDAFWSPQVPGFHELAVEFRNRCGDITRESLRVYAAPEYGEGDPWGDGYFSLAPNPAAGPVTLRLGEEGPTPASRALTPYTVQICDGMTVLRTLSGIGNTLAFSVADLPPGAYLVRVIRHGRVQSGYLVKR